MIINNIARVSINFIDILVENYEVKVGLITVFE